MAVTVLAAFGNVDVYVPEGVNVDVGGLTVFGHRRDWGATPVSRTPPAFMFAYSASPGPSTYGGCCAICATAATARSCVPSTPAHASLADAGHTERAGHDNAPGSVCSRGRAVAGAQVASRRKAQHGSSRTVFHEGSELEPGGH